MKFLILKVTAAFILCSMNQAHAADMIQGADASALINFLNANMSVVTSPFKVFHYFQGWGEFLGSYPSSDVRGYKYVKYNAPLFTKKLQHTFATMWGTGFYVATDPIESQSFGKDQNWTLIEIDIPKGFRFVNFNNTADLKVPSEAHNFLDSVGCTSWFPDLQSLFDTAHYPVSPSGDSCRSAMQEVFQRLQIDGFLFDWGSSFLKTCPHASKDHGSAFVIMSDRWLKPELVQIFNSQTTDNKEERLHLASVFYRSAADSITDIEKNHGSHNQIFYNLIFREFPGFSLADQPYPNSDGTWRFNIFNIANEERSITNFVLPKPDYPVQISSQHPPATLNYITGIAGFWKDLDGAITDKDIDTWIQENLLGCKDQPKYSAAQQ